MFRFRRAGRGSALWGLLLLSTRLWARPDGTALFREEVVDAPLKIGWKGPELTEETRFAVASSGLSWQPSLEGVPLVRREKKETRYTEAEGRSRAFLRAQSNGDRKAAFSFAFSLVLDPPTEEMRAWSAAYDHLAEYKTDFDKALIGILQAPEKLPLLPAYQYAAADILVHRAPMRLLPFFATLAGSSDRYLRSRAIAAIGVIGYRARPDGRNTLFGLLFTPREVSVSATLRSMMDEIVEEAAKDKNYRVRAAAALALGLKGDEADIPLLEKLAKDRAYLAFPERDARTKRIVFPVRAQAAASLARFGRTAEAPDGTYSGKELQRVTRGGKDVTNDRSDIRRDRSSQVKFTLGAW